MRANTTFRDIANDVIRRGGEIFEVTESRMRKLMTAGVAVPVLIKHRKKLKKTGPKVMIYQKLLYVIGGIETWDLQLAKAFQDHDLTFVFSEADPVQLWAISEYADVIMDDRKREYECDIFISANYDGGPVILDRVTAKKRYQTIHTDFEALKKAVPVWSNSRMKLDPRFDEVLAVSEAAQRGLINEFGIKSRVVPNLLAPAEPKPLTFVTLSRASEEKGIRRIAQMAREFERTNKKFVWFLASTLDAAPADVREEIATIPEIVTIQPQFHTQAILHAADYLVQLSDTEAYCYSIHQALQLGVPVIATRFSEAKKTIKPGKNGWLVDFDLSDLDVEKVFHRLKLEPKDPPIPKEWNEIFNGKS